jgi:hypothetical protein
MLDFDIMKYVVILLILMWAFLFFGPQENLQLHTLLYLNIIMFGIIHYKFIEKKLKKDSDEFKEVQNTLLIKITELIKMIDIEVEIWYENILYTVSKKNINHIFSNKLTLLDMSIYSNSLEKIKKLINIGADLKSNGLSPLFKAIRLCDIEIIKYIVEEMKSRNLSIDIVDNNKTTVLMHAIFRNDFEIIKYLVELKSSMNPSFDINTQNLEGDTALMIAARMNSFEIIEYLIQHGSNTQIKNKENQTIVDILKLRKETIYYDPRMDIFTQ